MHTHTAQTPIYTTYTDTYIAFTHTYTHTHTNRRSRERRKSQNLLKHIFTAGPWSLCLGVSSLKQFLLQPMPPCYFKSPTRGMFGPEIR